MESMVTHVKRLFSSSVDSRILKVGEFDFFIHEAKMIINKRPVASKNSLSQLTPEMVVRRYEIPFVFIVPQSMMTLILGQMIGVLCRIDIINLDLLGVIYTVCTSKSL